MRERTNESLKITAPVSEEVVSVAEVKLHSRIDGTSEDTLIAIYLQAAREECEHLTGRSIGEQTLLLQLDEWPEEDDVELPRPPLISVTSVQYMDGGTAKTVASGDYQVDDGQLNSWLLPIGDDDWPQADEVANAIAITYQAGYTTETVPAGIKAWILLRAASLYENREADSDRRVEPLQFATHLLDPYLVGGGARMGA